MRLILHATPRLRHCMVLLSWCMILLASTIRDMPSDETHLPPTEFAPGRRRWSSGSAALDLHATDPETRHVTHAIMPSVSTDHSEGADVSTFRRQRSGPAAAEQETPTDPAPVGMIETIIKLKPQEMWREGLTRQQLINEMDSALKIPGVSNIWTQPIRNRIDMLATGIQTPIGVKVFGEDLKKIEAIVNDPAD